METLQKISKQKAETQKVIGDIKEMQKDINSQEGKLSRTYNEVDYRLFEQCKRDQGLVPAYRLLVELHKANDDIIDYVRTTGQLKRSVKTLEESISIEKSKKIELKISQLKSDLLKIQQ